jgi:hypothetical protein
MDPKSWTRKWPFLRWPYAGRSKGAQYAMKKRRVAKKGGERVAGACGGKEGGSQNGEVARHQFQ